MNNKLDNEQEKRFDDKFTTGIGGVLVSRGGTLIVSEEVKQHIADEIAGAERKAVDGLVRLLLYPQELENTHPDIKNFNQLINSRYRVYQSLI